MPGKFKIQATSASAMSNIPISGAALLYDPQETPWFSQGDGSFTPGGLYSSLEISGIELVWEVLPQNHGAAIIAYYLDVIVPNGSKIYALQVPAKVSEVGSLWNAAEWKTYTQFDETGIQVSPPEWKPDGMAYRTLTWRFHNLTHLLER